MSIKTIRQNITTFIQHKKHRMKLVLWKNQQRKNQMSVQEFEEIYDVKFSYPNTIMFEEKFKEIEEKLNKIKYCCDIFAGTIWLHKDCWALNKCFGCSFLPIKQKYLDANGIKGNIEQDFIKANFMIDNIIK